MSNTRPTDHARLLQRRDQRSSSSSYQASPAGSALLGTAAVGRVSSHPCSQTSSSRSSQHSARAEKRWTRSCLLFQPFAKLGSSIKPTESISGIFSARTLARSYTQKGILKSYAPPATSLARSFIFGQQNASTSASVPVATLSA